MFDIFCTMCLWSPAQKRTIITGTQSLLGELFSNRNCTHKGGHPQLIGIDPLTGTYRTRVAQTYPAEMCEALARAHLDYMDLLDIEESMAPEVPSDDYDTDTDDPKDGVRLPVPEVGANWDREERWEETGRWLWQREEHNNILEARAHFAALVKATKTMKKGNKGVLIIGDSQVVVGAFHKGRNSRLRLNLVVRKTAALRIAYQIRLSVRYIRTHINFADAPSRGLPWGTMGLVKPTLEQ